MELYVMALLTIVGLVVRAIYMILKSYGNTKDRKPRLKPARTVICIGSGGHTAEMINLIENLDFTRNYTPRYYVMASSDKTSETKIHDLESCKKSTNNSYSIVKIPRSREVNQSYVTTVFTALHSLYVSLKVITRLRPNLILSNGPGSTCVPVCLLGFCQKLLFLNNDLKIVFVESICRVQTLSLSGRILYFIADHFIVQWPILKLKFQKAVFLGTFLK